MPSSIAAVDENKMKVVLYSVFHPQRLMNRERPFISAQTLTFVAGCCVSNRQGSVICDAPLLLLRSSFTWF
jgi:hypothetical protein